MEKQRIIQVYDNYMSDEKTLKKWSGNNLGNKFISEERYHLIRKLLVKYDIQLYNKKILEIGCAGGNIIPSLLKLGAIEENIIGIDVRPDRLNDAKETYPDINFSYMDASEMDFAKNSFDIVTIFTLFSSILNPKIRKQIASEVYRVLKPNGVVLYYDFRYNNPVNQNVIGINKIEINSIFPDMNKTLKLVTVLPPISRVIGKMTPYLYPILSTIPLLRSHYLGIFFK